MKRIISVIALILAFIIVAPAKESKIRLTGRVRDKITQSSVMGAKVTIYDSKQNLIDSVKARGGSYDRIRNAYVETSDFSILVPKKKEILTLEVTYENYDTLLQSIDLTNVGSRENERSLGTFYISKEQKHTLNEVSVTASKIKFFLKGDTIVYNADAFSLPEGSMLDALIDQMPGVEIREGGEIYVNGRYVDELLLNGKDFFNKDKQLMLNNIGAYTVQNIEVYNRQTDDRKFTGNTNEFEKEYVMDVKLKKEYIGGWNFSFEAGGGTDSRYLGRFFGMHFTALKQFTLFAHTNNLNNDQRPNGKISFSGPTMTSGLNKVTSAGFDYAIENADATQKYSGNIVVNIGDNLLEQTSISTRMLPTQNTFSNSISRKDAHSLNLKSAFMFQWQTKSTFNRISPSISHSYNRNEIASKTANYLSEQNPETIQAALGKWPETEPTISAKEDLINAIFNESFGHSYTTKYGVDANTKIKIPRTSDNLGLAVSASRSESPSFQHSTYLINYGDPALTPVARRQYTRNKPVHNTTLDLGANYELNLNPELSFDFYYKFKYINDQTTTNFYLAQLASDYSGDYTIDNIRRMSMELDPSNSNFTRQPKVQNSIYTCMRWQINKSSSLGLYYHTHFSNRWIDYEQASGRQHLRETGIELWQQTVYTYFRNFDKKQIYISFYNVLDRSQPPLLKMIDIDNTTDPLTRYLPNPDLKYHWTDDLHFSAHYNTPKVSASLDANARFTFDDVVNGYMYDTATGMSTYKSYNVNGNYRINLYGYAAYSFNQKRRLCLYLPYDRQVYHNMIGEDAESPIKSKVTTNNYRFGLRYFDKIGSCFDYSVNFGPSWRRSKSDLQPNLNLNVNEIHWGAYFTLKLPYAWEVFSEFTFNYRSGYSDPEMNGNQCLWDAHIGKSFMKGSLTLNIDAYDLLKQVKTVSYSISADSRVETFSNTLPRYVLLRATYKFDIQPKKHKLASPETFRF